MADWISRYSAALEVRDERESRHRKYVDAYTRLADRKPAFNPADPTSSSTKNTPPTEDPETTALRANLTATQRARNTLQTTLNTLTLQNSTLQSQLGTAQTSLQSSQRQIAMLERRLRDREEELRQKMKMVQGVQDEMVGLELELNVAVGERERLKGENEELVRRWVQRMGVEVEEMNERGGWK